MGRSPNWSYDYVPTAVEWTYWFQQKQDDLSLSKASVVALQYGVNSPGGLVGYSSSGVAGALGYTPLNPANNLSDLPNPAAARTNLGFSISGSFAIAGGYTVTLAATANTAVILPTSGLLFANPMTTAGDIVYGSTDGAASRLGIGTPGQIMAVSVGGVPTWQNQIGGGNVSNSGTPTSGQIAVWTAAATVQGVTPTGTGSPVLAVSPALSGAPTAPTATGGTNTTQIATTAFVQAAIPSDYLKTDATDQTITDGANVTAALLSAGNITVDCGQRPLQYTTNGGAFTITAPSNDGSCVLLVTNNASAGAIAFSGFTVGSSTGDALTTVNGSKFMIYIVRINGVSSYTIKALQ